MRIVPLSTTCGFLSVDAIISNLRDNLGPIEGVSSLNEGDIHILDPQMKDWGNMIWFRGEKLRLLKQQAL